MHYDVTSIDTLRMKECYDHHSVPCETPPRNTRLGF